MPGRLRRREKSSPRCTGRDSGRRRPNFRQALRQTRLPARLCRAELHQLRLFHRAGHSARTRSGRTGDDGIAGQEIVYCDPVGLHPAMTEALLQPRAPKWSPPRAKPIDEPARTACLFICGHGTSFNDNSTKIIHEQAAAIRALAASYADCQAGADGTGAVREGLARADAVSRRHRRPVLHRRWAPFFRGHSRASRPDP